jgi:flagellar biosynthetic protein FliP
VIGSGLPGVLAALGVTLALLFLAVQVLKRFQGIPARGGAGRIPLRILKRTPLGPRQGVGLLQVGSRVIVISMGENGSRYLTELEGEDLAEVIEDADPDSGKRPAGNRRLWGKLLPAFAILVVGATLFAGPVRAQTSPVRSDSAQSAPDAPLPAVSAPTVNSLSGLGPPVNLSVGQGNDQVRFSGAVGVVVFIGALTLLPAILLLMTSFTRILVVLQFLRPAMGTQNTPPVQLLVALSLLLTGFVMGPVVQKVNTQAVQPYMRGEMDQARALTAGMQPFREFMLANTGQKDLVLFTRLAHLDNLASPEDVPTLTLASAFVTSELRTAFQMGFMIFIPFIVVDLIVASVLMSLGMFMLPPMMVSLPFKLLLFVLADGWTLVVKNLVTSFGS